VRFSRVFGALDPECWKSKELEYAGTIELRGHFAQFEPIFVEVVIVCENLVLDALQVGTDQGHEIVSAANHFLIRRSVPAAHPQKDNEFSDRRHQLLPGDPAVKIMFLEIGKGHIPSNPRTI